MLTVVLVSLAVPIAAVAAGLAARHKQPRLVANTRGIALQTVIIIVVLVAIAGGVSVALIGQGGDAIEEIDDIDITVDRTTITDEHECRAAGGTWAASKCS